MLALLLLSMLSLAFNIQPVKGYFNDDEDDGTLVVGTLDISVSDSPDPFNPLIEQSTITHYSITGMVYYSDTPLDGVRVELVQGEVWNPPLQTTFSSNGHYLFSFVVPGSYFVKAYAPNSMYMWWKSSSIEVVYDDVARDIDLPKLMTLLSPGSGAVVASLHPTLTWEANPEAAFYLVQVNVRGTWELVEFEESVSTEHTISALLSPGVEYMWMIDAHDFQHRHVGTTQTLYTFTVEGLPSPEIKVTRWGTTNLWEVSSLHHFLNELASTSGYRIDCIVDVFVTNDDSISMVKIKLSTGEVLSLPEKDLGHYSLHLQKYVFSEDRYLNYLSALLELLFKSLGYPTFRIPAPESTPEVAITEIIITDTEMNIHRITQSEVGQTLPEQLPTYEGAVSTWIKGPGTLFITHSPVDLLIKDIQGRRVGAIYESGIFISEINEIEGAFYGGQGLDLQFIYAPNSFENYIVEVIGRGSGDYILEVLTFEEEEGSLFTAIEIPLTHKTVHQYTVDWAALSQDEEGVTVEVDSDGDGVFEHTFTADSELTYDEFMLQTATTLDFDPATLNLKSNGQYITAYITLPEEYSVEEIDPNSVYLEDIEVAFSEIQGDVFMAKFDRARVQAAVRATGDYQAEDSRFVEITLTVTGEVAGTPFLGSDTIKVIKK